MTETVTTSIEDNEVAATKGSNSAEIRIEEENSDNSDITLNPEHEKILKDQILPAETKASYSQLYQTATKRDWIIMAVGLVFACGAGAAMPLMTIIFGRVVDSFTLFLTHQMTDDEFSSEINTFSTYFAYLAISTFVATYIYMATWVYTGERQTRQIRERYLRAVLRQNIAYFDGIGPGEITTRISSDTHLIQDGISEKFAISFQYLSTFISAFIIAFATNWKMALVICCVVPVIATTSIIINKFNSLYTKRSSDFYSFAGTIAEESLAAIRTTVAFGAQKKLSTLYNTYLRDARREGIRKQILNSSGVGILFFFVYCTYSVGFWYGSTLLLKNEVTPGKVVNVFFAVIIGAFSLAHLAPDLQAFGLATGAGAKIFETINRIPPIDSASPNGEKPTNCEGRIQFKNTSFIYPSRPSIMALNNVSLDIEPGTTVALVGTSGSGKSTIVSLSLRFYDPISGEILLDGRDIKSLNVTWLRRQMSLVGQEPVLFNTTIAENVAHGLIGSIYENISDDKKRIMVEHACQMSNAHGFIMNLPEKYDSMVGEGGLLLSGGQKQRIAIARAIIKDPKILLLDEATSALDSRSEGIVQDALDKASKDRTTIVVAHRLSTVRNATKIIVMGDGSIIESGTHDELMAKKGAYSQLVEAQQLQQAEEKQDSLDKSIVPPEDADPLLVSNQADIIPEEDYQLGRVTSNKSVSSAVLAKRKDDLEANMKHEYDYTTWELIKKIGKMNRPEITVLFIGLIASIANGSVYPIFSLIFANILQSFSTTGAELQHDATFWALMFLVIAVGTSLSSIIQGSCFGYSGESLTRKIRSATFDAMLRQDISFFDEDKHTTGSLTSALALDATHVNGLAGITLGTLLQVLTTVIGGLVVALVVGWKLALVCMCCIPVMLGAGSLRMRMLNGFQQKTKKAYENSANVACESSTNIRTVAALTREDDVLNIYHHMLDEPMRQGFKNAFLASIAFAFAQCVTFLANALAFWYGGRLIMTGEYDLRRMFTVFMAVIFGSMSAGRAFAYAPDVAKAKSAAASIMSIIERVPTIDAWSHTGKKIEKIEGHLKFTNVHFRYPTRPHVPVLRGLDIEIRPGQFAALVGPSGCGKSTTISLTERFYDITDGRIEIDGIDITTINVSNLRENISLVSQEPSLYDMTIKENIIFGCRPGQQPTQDDIEKACREAHIHDFIIGLPNGYDTRVGGKGKQLSGGQKQRVAIARALIRNPKILLLDEATSALDSQAEKVVQEALDVAAKGRTTLAIAHRLSSIQNADIIFVIRDGKVHERGTHQELLAQKGMYYTMVQEQDLGVVKE
ncbi:P-loop containing nucleoside triphosphate hydrolase protein [Gigaspora margarita]|uniref:P-loop containing nucleoside triphosphate hydrolase protein n=1 Tax=Gigaspora margarita TaxID=4874 RepID=A0A8H3XDH7_GIGMA|nr:P-loop containing nucleoside triphosphate hydrolase protein [Gigaspora margarita]